MITQHPAAALAGVFSCHWAPIVARCYHGGFDAGDTFLLSTEDYRGAAVVAAGISTCSVCFEVRLSQLKFSEQRNRYVSSTVAVELVRGGIAYPIKTFTWQNFTGNPLQVGFTKSINALPHYSNHRRYTAKKYTSDSPMTAPRATFDLLG